MSETLLALRKPICFNVFKDHFAKGCQKKERKFGAGPQGKESHLSGSKSPGDSQEREQGHTEITAGGRSRLKESLERPKLGVTVCIGTKRAKFTGRQLGCEAGKAPDS